jgi:hypothetical protein
MLMLGNLKWGRINTTLDSMQQQINISADVRDIGELKVNVNTLKH